MSTKTATKNQAQEKKEFNLERVLVLWIYEKTKGKYLSGRMETGEKLIGFFNTQKQNPKEPDIKIYQQVAKGEELGDPILSLWVNASDSGKKYITGKLNGKWVIGFFNSKAEVNGVIPYINVYFQEEQEVKEDNSEESKEVDSNSDLPF